MFRFILVLFLFSLLPTFGFSQIADDRQEYQKDSMQIMDLLDLQWRYYWEERLDSLLHVTIKCKQISKRWKKHDPFFSTSFVLAEGGIGQVYCMQGHYSKGLPIMESALNDLRKLDEIPDVLQLKISQSYVGLGWIFEEVGDLEKALECHIEAERIQSELVKKGAIPISWLVFKSRNLGDIYFKLEQYELSEQLYKKAIQQVRENYSNCTDVFYLGILAGFYIKVGDHNKANTQLKQIKSALNSQTCKNIKEVPAYYAYLFEIGSAYFEIDSFEMAMATLEPVLAPMSLYPKSADANKARYETKALLIIAKSNLALKQITLAKKHLERAKKVWLSFNTIHNDFWYQLELADGEIQLMQKDWSAALSCFDRILSQNLPGFDGISSTSLTDISNWPLSPWIMQTLQGRMEAQFSQWQTEQSSVDLQDLLRETDLTQRYLENLLLTYTTDYSKSKVFLQSRSVYEIPIQLCISQFERTGDPQYLEKLFYYFEKSKALQLLTTVKEKQLQSFYGVSDELLGKTRDVRREINFFKKKITEIYNNTSKNPEQKNEYQDRLNSLQLTFDSLQLVLQNEYPAYYNLTQDLSVITLSDIQQSLENNELLISYFWGNNQLYAIASSQERTNTWTIPLNKDFLHQLDAFRQLIITPPAPGGITEETRETFDQGLKLFQSILFPGLKDREETRKITLLPDGPLTYLPWAALPTALAPKASSFRAFPFLIKELALQQEYSATLLRTDIPRTRQEIPYIGVAPDYQNDSNAIGKKMDTLKLRSAFGQDFRLAYGPLKYNLPEIENAGKLYTKGIKLVGEDATESQFKKYVNRGNILHLAMHAATNDKDPMLSHLFFSNDPDSLDDGILYAYELYNMNIPSELAILSACNTGAGKMLDGQGVMSLARAFKYAGCRDVLMTHWPAHDRSTAKMIAGFFHYYQEANLSKAEALQKTTLDYLQQESNEALVHPYYWAGLTLIGTGEPTNRFFNWFSIWAWAIGGSVMLLAIAFSFIRMRSKT